MATWAQKIKAHGAKQAKPRKAKLEVQVTWAQTRAPDLERGDPGAVTVIHYTVDENTVALTDEAGKPIGGKAGLYVMQPGDTAVQIAKRVGLARWRETNDAFNRPLNYQPLGTA